MGLMAVYRRLVKRHIKPDQVPPRWSAKYVKSPEIPPAKKQRRKRTEKVQTIRHERVKRYCQHPGCGEPCHGKRCFVHYRLARYASCLLALILVGCVTQNPNRSPIHSAATKQTLDVLTLIEAKTNTVTLSRPPMPLPFPVVSESASERATVSSAIATAVAPSPQVELAFDASADVVAGYRIYFGSESGRYTNSVTTLTTTARINNLTPGVTYYFTAVAYTAEGMQSKTSNEVSYTVPTEVATYRSLTKAENVQYWLWTGPDATLQMSTNLATILVTFTNTSGVVTNRPALVQTNWRDVGPITANSKFGATNNLPAAFWRVRIP